MSIHTIQNNTGSQLQLWDVGVSLANLANGQAANQLPITITSVTRNGVGLHNRTGSFADNENYSATFVQASNSVLFTGNHGHVSFA